MRKGLFIILLLIALPLGLLAQWECPSQLAAFLKPIGKSKFYVGSEITGGLGYLTDNSIINGMGYLGIDRSGEKSTFYIEGGFKYWYRYDLEKDASFSDQHFGLRELFYQYRSPVGRITLGLQSARFDDDYLFNERMIGINYEHTKGAWAVNFSGGTVTKDFARNGIFCAVSYLYDIIPGRQLPLIGNKPGQTNFSGVTFKFTPSKMKKKQSTENLDEFSPDGFSNAIGTETSGSRKFSLETAGIALYDEFGSWVPENVFIGGLFSEFRLPADIYFKPEILYQASQNNQALIFTLGLEKSLNGSKSRTHFYLRYYGIYALDANAKALNSFSNIFAGNVLRLDAMDLPFVQLAIRYRLPEIRTHLKLQYILQTRQNPMQELDLAIVKKIGKHMQASAIGGFIKSNLLKDDAFLGRFEFRVSL